MSDGRASEERCSCGAFVFRDRHQRIIAIEMSLLDEGRKDLHGRGRCEEQPSGKQIGSTKGRDRLDEENRELRAALRALVEIVVASGAPTAVWWKHAELARAVEAAKKALADG